MEVNSEVNINTLSDSDLKVLAYDTAIEINNKQLLVGAIRAELEKRKLSVSSDQSKES